MAVWLLCGSLLHAVIKHGDVLNTNISQSSVAMQLRCGGFFNDSFTANLPLNLSVKEFWKSAKLWLISYRRDGVVLFWKTAHRPGLSNLSAMAGRIDFIIDEAGLSHGHVIYNFFWCMWLNEKKQTISNFSFS